MTGVYIDNSRRGYNHRCVYFKKENKNDSSLKHSNIPSGVFYAREAKQIQKDLQEIVGAYQNQYKTIAIETTDGPKIDSNDIVNYNNEDWIVLSTMEREILKRSEFANNSIKYMQIVMRR